MIETFFYHSSPGDGAKLFHLSRLCSLLSSLSDRGWRCEPGASPLFGGAASGHGQTVFVRKTGRIASTSSGRSSFGFLLEDEATAQRCIVVPAAKYRVGNRK